MMLELIILLIIIIINSFTVYKFYFHMIFKDIDDINESIKFTLTPDLFLYLEENTSETEWGNLN